MFVAVADDVKISRGIASHRRSSMRLIIHRIWFRSRYSDQMFRILFLISHSCDSRREEYEKCPINKLISMTFEVCVGRVLFCKCSLLLGKRKTIDECRDE